MDAATKQLVRLRAGNCCEYCRLPQDAVPLVSFHAEHVIARQHGICDELDNFAFSCHRCNAFKGPNLSSIDHETGAIVLLFHPRTDKWTDHFKFQDAEIVGLTPTGRATLRLLKFNDRYRIKLREAWSSDSSQ